MIKKIFLPLFFLIVVGCQSTPGTGRSQLILVNQSEISSMAAGEFAKMKKVPNDPRLERIRSIGLKIVEVARREDKYRVLPPANQWQFAIIDDESPNAFAMPGGKIGFNKGMFAYAPSDEDIAVILGHEVSHVLARHSSERVSQNLLAQVGSIAVDEATKHESSAVRRAWMSGFGLGAQVGVLLPFSRAHEEEADHLGIIFMARAGYNPEAAPAFWQRFSKAGGKKPPEFFSTHPADETRVRKLLAWLPEAKAQMPKSVSP
ncbi:M48 family peptidase [bacterium]|nr:M48 family peptidase [bacterium]